MINSERQVSRKALNEDRIAICPQFGCKHLEKVKPLKFGIIGFRKYPKCSKHKNHLVFVDEFIGNFIHAVNACLFDNSSLPPENLIRLIKIEALDELKNFINGWIYCNPIGRGAQIVSQYMDGLSRAYMKLLSRKQRKVLKNTKSSKKRYEILRMGLKKIADEYTTFLQELREKSEVLYDPENLNSLSNNMLKILKTWLKEHLKTIKGINIKQKNKSPIQDECLSMLKEDYDKILHAGTCVLLLGKSPSIVIKSIPAFELFSAYYEFLKGGLCIELKREDVLSIFEDNQDFLKINEENPSKDQENENEYFFNELENMKETNTKNKNLNGEIIKISNIKISNFKPKVRDTLKTILTSINSTEQQKKIIWSKSLDILDEFISRAENNEFIIQKHANCSNIAATIIYTVLITNKKMPQISAIQLEKKLRLLKNLPSKKEYHEISRLYNKYFKRIYPRAEFRFESGFKAIKNIISLHFFELIKNTKKEIRTTELVLFLKENVLKYNFTSFLEGMTKERIDIVRKMATEYENEFNKYFSDLVQVIKGIIKYSKVPKKISSSFSIRPLVDDLNEHEIDLLHGFTNFYHSVLEIYDALKNNFPYDLPKRFNRSLSEKYEKQEYVNIVGHKIKLYTIEHIYNGLYFINGKARCPQCYEEGLMINTDSIRSTSLEYHHSTKKKESEYSAIKMFQMYQKSRSNPLFLENLINKMESDKVKLLCRVHHQIEHSKYYNYFEHLINLIDIFSLPAQLIHILIRISIENFHKTKNFSIENKRSARDSIIVFLKKRYIFEKVYGERCPTCLEFNIKEHLPAFDFNHLDKHHYHENPYIKEEHHGYIKSVAGLYNKDYNCSEIAKILEFEEGGYLCKNCHKVIDYSSIHLKLLDEIYEDRAHVKEILNDYIQVKKRFKKFYYINLINEPLKKLIRSQEELEEYLDAIYVMSQHGDEITHNSLANYLGLKRHTIFQYLKRRKSFFRDFINIDIGMGHGYESTRIALTKQGKIYIELIYSFRDYYKNLKN
jgi:hypothetical protein